MDNVFFARLRQQNEQSLTMVDQQINNTNQASGEKKDSEDKQEKELPEYFDKFRTKETIPCFFRDETSLPGRLAVSDSNMPATRILNQSYERQKRIEQKRATENAIQRVANLISNPTETKAKLSEKELSESL